jgi:hypothetical protein
MERPALPPAKPERPRRRGCCAVALTAACLLAVGWAVYYFVLPPYTWRGWIDNERKVPPAWVADVPADNARDAYVRFFPTLEATESESDFLVEWAKVVLRDGRRAGVADLPRARAALERRADVVAGLREGAGKPYALGAAPVQPTDWPELRLYQQAAYTADAAALVAYVEGRDDEALAIAEDVASLGVGLCSGESPSQVGRGGDCIAAENCVVQEIVLRLCAVRLGSPQARRFRGRASRASEPPRGVSCLPRAGDRRCRLRYP